MRILYRTITLIFYPLIIIFIYLRRFYKKEDKKRYKEKLFSSCFNIKRNYNLKLIWFHAASIGELKSILPVIDELDKNNSYEFLVTTVTLSSANLAENELKRFKRATHRFFPIDVKFLMEKFLDLWKPDAIFLVDSEIWPNLIFLSSQKKIPISIINARITFKSYKRWMMVPNFAKSIFNQFNLCLASNKETKKYLENLNAKNIFCFGNIKFCETYESSKYKNENISFLISNIIWFAASTHEGEDLLCLKTHKKLKNKIKDIVTIIAPRHIDRVKQIKKISEQLNLNSQVLNKGDLILKNKEIIIINSFGGLNNFFKYSKSVFIGKSMLKKLKDVGGQNPIEAAKMGCKVYHGPYVYNFNEIYELLAENKVSNKITSSEELYECLSTDLKSKKRKNSYFENILKNIGEKILKDTVLKINSII
tara:strand:+ start:1246 stop:2511 length:1266 start_codon:yes stop_codon:yes gene_type:complete